MAEKKRVTIRGFTREKDGTTTPGDQVAIRGGLSEVFAYLAKGVDWNEFESGLSEVESAGFRADLATGASVVVLVRAPAPLQDEKKGQLK